MASSAAGRVSIEFARLQMPRPGAWTMTARHAVERWLEGERDQLALWLPVALGAGLAAWFLLPDPHAWTVVILASLALACAALTFWRGGRAGVTVATGALLVASGVGLVWWRAERVAAPVLTRPAIATFTARVTRYEPVAARALVRVRLQPIGTALDGKGQSTTLPPQLRVNILDADVPPGLGAGAVVKLRARLMPPAAPAIPGAYDFARQAWFDGIGATGRALPPATLIARGSGPTLGRVRQTLGEHILKQAGGGGPAAIAVAFVTGDMGAISQSDSEAMRRAGLAHLLSISGLHVTAVVVTAIWVASRLLALSPWLALRTRIPMLAAGAGAVAAIGYTLLSGAEVPTVRSCVASLLVLGALMLGRQAITLRLVAAGAFGVLAFWPEALAGPSFQLSFAAVTSLISFHEHPRVKGWFKDRDEPWTRRVRRHLASLLLTGLVVELTLAPIGLYHFHKQGLYGAVANIVAIPLTTFLVMPAEALALVLDLVGLGWPAWWVVATALKLLLWIAHVAASAPGALAMLPAMPGGAFACMVTGGIWVTLWRTRWRSLGWPFVLAGAVWALGTPAPDLLIGGDGKHLAIRTPDGRLALLRERAGDYTVATFSENAGIDGEAWALADQPDARCSDDACIAERVAGGRRWRILATRSPYAIPRETLLPACTAADIVVSDRRLPRACAPRWLKLDAWTLRRSGGVAVSLASGQVTTVLRVGDQHPWRAAAMKGEGGRRRWRHGPAARRTQRCCGVAGQGAFAHIEAMPAEHQ